MTRHQRRKAAHKRQADKLERLAIAARAEHVASVVAGNLSSPHRPRLTPRGLIGSIYDKGRSLK